MVCVLQYGEWRNEIPRGYASSIRSLAQQYREDIQILLGLEVEYYPKFFPRLLEMVREAGIEYMILGQHYIFNEIEDDIYIGKPFREEARLKQYVSQTIEAMETGLFTYFAHPDLPAFQGDNDLYAEEMRKICKAAKKTSTPLEINLLGLRDDRNYPDLRFWKLAGEEGNEVILGSDAHMPWDVLDPDSIKRAYQIIDRYSLNLIETVELRQL